MNMELTRSLTWKSASDANEAESLAVHTQNIANNIERTRTDTVVIELTTQNFRLTGDTGRLHERDMAIEHREALLKLIQTQILQNRSRVLAIRREWKPQMHL